MSRKNNPMFTVGHSYTVDTETGEAVPIEGGGMKMLPGPKGTCEWCHVKHDPVEPHNQQSLPYQMKFHAINGRWPTWSDAMAHCTPEVKTLWREQLRELMAEKGMDIPPDLQEGGAS